MMAAPLEPRRVQLQALGLLRSSAALVGSDYLVFLALSFFALVLGKLAPFQILLGPALCGVFLAFRAKSRGQRPVLEDFVHGFAHFADAAVATLVLVLVLFFLTVTPALLFGVAAVLAVEVWDVSEPLVAWSIAPLVLYTWAVLLAVVSAGAFVYPAIIDGASATQALRASLQACWLNRWGVLRLVLLNWLVAFFGLCTCCVGFYLVQPFTLGALWLAYREVFPAAGTERAAASASSAVS